MDTDYVKSLNINLIPLMVKIPIRYRYLPIILIISIIGLALKARMQRSTTAQTVLIYLTLGTFLKWGLTLVFLTFLFWGVLKAGQKKHNSSTWVKIRLHNENQLPRLSVSA